MTECDKMKIEPTYGIKYQFKYLSLLADKAD